MVDASSRIVDVEQLAVHCEVQRGRIAELENLLRMQDFKIQLRDAQIAYLEGRILKGG